METEAQSHSDVGRKWLGIETLEHYKEHHTAREYEQHAVNIKYAPDATVSINFINLLNESS